METKKYPKTVAVAGTQNRIGTTTQALQMCLYLHILGYKVCYVEYNSNSLVSRFKKALYDEIKDNDKYITYENIDMYYSLSRKEEIYFNYDYVVYDYGNINEILDEKFLLNDYSILVTGSKPQEILSLLLVLEHYNNKNIKVLLSFTSELALEKINEFLSNAVNKYFRIPYSDEYFIYNIANTQIYNDIFRFTEEEFTDAVKREKRKNKKSKLKFFRKEGKSKEKNKKVKIKDKGKKLNHNEKEDKE